MARRPDDVSRGAGPWVYKYRLAVLSFIHKTESYGQGRDTRSWDLIVVVVLLEAVKFGLLFFSGKFLEGFF